MARRRSFSRPQPVTATSSAAPLALRIERLDELLQPFLGARAHEGDRAGLELRLAQHVHRAAQRLERAPELRKEVLVVGHALTLTAARAVAVSLICAIPAAMPRHAVADPLLDVLIAEALQDAAAIFDRRLRMPGVG